MLRNSTRTAVLGVALALLAGACSNAATPTPTSVASPTPISTPTLTPRPVRSPTADAAVVAAPTPASASTVTPTPAPSTAEDAANEPPDTVGDALVEPDPNFREALDAARFSTAVWETDFSLHTVPYSEITSGGVGRDGIPPLDDPRFVAADQADEWLSPLEPVIALEVDGVAKAYPLQILTRHEIANDEIAGVPVAVTFCPLCNSAVVFDRRFDGQVLDFGVSGNLRNSDLVMWDRQTQSWWQQLTGEGIVGRYAGAQLDFIPAQLLSWETFRDNYPGSNVLSQDTGFRRQYGSNPYVGYDRLDQRPFLFSGPLDDRLPPMERVAAVNLDGASAAFPFSRLEEERVVNYVLGGRDIVVFFKPGTTSALDQRSIADSADVGSTGLFDARIDGRRLMFAPSEPARDGVFRDDETGSTWNILGVATAGPLEGAQLERIVHQDHFWFAWAAFEPGTLLYQGER